MSVLTLLPIIVDNESVVSTAKLYDQITQRNRHIETRYFKIQEFQENQYVDVTWRRGKNNPADVFTKALSKDEGHNHIEFLLSGYSYDDSILGGCQVVKKPKKKKLPVPIPSPSLLSSVFPDIPPPAIVAGG